VNRYRKLIVGIVGLAIIAGQDFLNLPIGGADAAQITDLVISLATAAGIWYVPNAA